MNKSLRTFLRALPALGLAGLSIWVLSGVLSPRALLDAFATVRPGLLLLALGAYCGSLLSRHLRWWFLIAPVKRLSARRTLSLCGIAILSVEVIPLKPVSELVRPLLLRDTEGVPIATALAATFLERVLDVVSLALLFTAVFWGGDALLAESWEIALTDSWTLDLGAVAARLGTIAGLAGLFVLGSLMVLGPKAAQFLGRLVGRVLPRLEAPLVRLFGRLADGLGGLRKARSMGALVLTTVAVWGLNVVAILLFARAFGAVIAPLGAALALVILVAGMMAPAAPGYAGTFELLLLVGLSLSGVPEDLGATIGLAFHGCHLLLVACFGLPFLLLDGVRFGQLVQSARALTRPAGLTSETAPSAPPPA